MATLDELSSQLAVLQSNYNSLANSVGRAQDDIHNLGTRLDTAETKLQQHAQKLAEHDTKLQNHEERLIIIENSTLKYKVSRDVKYLKKTTDGFLMYMPKNLTIEEIMAINHGVVKQHWNWLNKIFNPNGYGRVSFDLDKEEGKFIKNIVLGQNTRVLIPTGIILTEFTPFKSMFKVVNETNNSMYKGLQFGIEVVDETDKEIIISVSNPTSNIITLKAGEVLVQVLHLFSYHTTPEIIQ